MRLSQKQLKGDVKWLQAASRRPQPQHSSIGTFVTCLHACGFLDLAKHLHCSVVALSSPSAIGETPVSHLGAFRKISPTYPFCPISLPQADYKCCNMRNLIMSALVTFPLFKGCRLPFFLNVELTQLTPNVQ
jgi:hypothetical protein